MVNRVMVVVLAAIVVTAMAVGVLAGMQFAGGDGSTPATPTTGTGTGTGTTTTALTTTATTRTETAATTATTTATTTTATTTAATTTAVDVSPATVNATAVERAIRRNVNDHRQQQGLDELGRLRNLTLLAEFHSSNMAEQGYPSHTASGFTTRERYERFGLSDQCRLADPSSASIYTDQDLEIVSRTRPDTVEEESIAQRLVENWIGDDESRRKLDYEVASLAGVGVTVTEDGFVYATVNLC